MLSIMMNLPPTDPKDAYEIRNLASVDSTNNYAMARISEGEVTEGMVYLAERQTAGRGQRGKSWQAEAGKSILMTMVLRPSLMDPSRQFLLNAEIALAAYDLFDRHAHKGSSIKWSNDIYWDDRKAGGILIENILRGGRWNYALAGIGLNINQEYFPANLPNPVSLRQASGRAWDIATLARELCEGILQRYRSLPFRSPSAILEEYKSHLYRYGEWGRFRQDQRIFGAFIRDLREDGKLVLETKEGLIEVDFGNLEFLPGIAAS